MYIEERSVRICSDQKLFNTKRTLFAFCIFCEKEDVKSLDVEHRGISVAVGHADSKVTRHYLSRFEDDLIDETNSVL